MKANSFFILFAIIFMTNFLMANNTPVPVSPTENCEKRINHKECNEDDWSGSICIGWIVSVCVDFECDGWAIQGGAYLPDCTFDMTSGDATVGGVLAPGINSVENLVNYMVANDPSLSSPEQVTHLEVISSTEFTAQGNTYSIKLGEYPIDKSKPGWSVPLASE